MSDPEEGSLRAAQQAFWRAVRYDPTPDDALAYFAGDARLATAERLSIYRSMYWYRQIDALADSFPKLRELLGPERFTKLATRYIRDNPSRHPALEYLGRALPEYLVEHAPQGAALARLEWARNLALLAPEPAGICTPQHVDPHTFARARVRFVASLQVIEVDDTALCAFEPERPRDCGDARVAVWRRGFGVRHMPLSAAEVDAHSRVRAGETMGEVLASFEADERGIAQAFKMVKSWFARAWVEAIEV